MSVWIVLPAYNEDENLPHLLDQFRELLKQSPSLDIRLIVVDDGSSDNTQEVLSRCTAQLSVEVLKNEANMGLARAFKRGMLEAANKSKQGDVIVCMDADNTHIPGQIPTMLEKIRQGCDVVIASRYQKGAVVKGVPLVRRLLSRGMSLLFCLIYPIKAVRDYSCGYRAYRTEFLQKVLDKYGETLFAEEGFACMVCILLRLVRENAVCGEVPLNLRYDRKAGLSKMKVAVTIVRTLLVLVRERFKRANKVDYQMSKGRKNDL
jgi:dolichol-phosphate mannosyltransferase